MTTNQAAHNLRFAHSESIYIDASPQQVWDVVTDVERTGEWSPVCRAGWWKEPATRPEVGAWFHGRNEAGGRSWETQSQVVAAEEPAEFAWMVAGNAVRWSYAITPDGNGTSLTESWAVEPAGFTLFEKLFGEDADAQLEVRREDALAGIPTTLKAIKQIIEAS
ncbi:SRPBCC family protein [Tomitella biformata]|uniref:SRPBCC family protein n=1 Tax=Tomitella biformata TaxID=630403 RepID=UPI000467EC33|nr:SRPBCC family protein [Tomitella biformata]